MCIRDRYDNVDAFPDAAKELLGEEIQKSNGNVGWLSIVGILENEREVLRERRINAYEVVSSAVAQSAHSLDIEMLYGNVRVGDSANTSKKNHLGMGLQGTNLFFMDHGHQYEILSLDPCDIPFITTQRIGIHAGSLVQQKGELPIPVSYTHLTLPTICSV